MEALMMKIRGVTMSYSAFEKKVKKRESIITRN